MSCLSFRCAGHVVFWNAFCPEAGSMGGMTSSLLAGIFGFFEDWGRFRDLPRDFSGKVR